MNPSPRCRGGPLLPREDWPGLTNFLTLKEGVLRIKRVASREAGALGRDSPGSLGQFPKSLENCLDGRMRAVVALAPPSNQHEASVGDEAPTPFSNDRLIESQFPKGGVGVGVPA